VLRFFGTASVIAAAFTAEFLHRISLAILTAAYVPSYDDSGPTQFVILTGCLLRPMVAAAVGAGSMLILGVVAGRRLVEQRRQVIRTAILVALASWAVSLAWIGVEILVLNRMWP